MSYYLDVEKKDEVLWVKATGTRSFENVLAISKDIMAACTEHEVKRVLLDVRPLKGRLSTMEAYEIPDKYFPKIRDRSVVERTAIVDWKEANGRAPFFELVAENRGFVLHIFPKIDQALHWLTS